MQAEGFVEHWLAQARDQVQRLQYALPFLPEPVRPVSSADDWLAGRLDDIPKLAWLALWPLALLAVWVYLKGENDRPIRYRIPSPKTPDREEYLSNPSIKV